MSQTTNTRSSAGAPSPQDRDALAQFLELARPIMGVTAPLLQQIGRLLQNADIATNRVLHPTPEDTPHPVPKFEGKNIILPNGMILEIKDFQERWAKLTEPFPEDELENRPNPVGKDDQKYKCEPRTRASVDGKYCGGFHTPSTHFTYVGHAGITDRLNEVDPFWYPSYPKDKAGFPLMSDLGVMWGELTVLGITRPGVGDVGKNNAGNPWAPFAQKELIGDFYRNAAMRFGVGTYLWAKSEAAERKQRGQWEAQEAELVWGNREAAAAAKAEDTKETADIRRARQDNAAEASQTRPHPNVQEPAPATPGENTRLAGPPAGGYPWDRIPKSSLPITDESWWWERWDYYLTFGVDGFTYFKNIAMWAKSGCPETVQGQIGVKLQELIEEEASKPDNKFPEDPDAPDQA